MIPSKPVKQQLSTDDDMVVSAVNGGILEVDIDKIIANHLQPRKQFRDIKLEELRDSIKEHGMIQPLVGTKTDDGYELIAGGRRLRASKLAGLKKVPLIVREASEQQKLELALIENVQRENLNAIDLAESYQQLMNEFNLTQEEVAKRVGKARSSIANTIRMLQLPEEIKLALIDRKLTEGHAKYLIGLDSEVKQLALFRKILHQGMSVSDTNHEVRRMGGTKNAKIKINYEDKDKEFLLREYFGAKVEIKRKGEGGEIVMHFFSEDELNEILQKLK